MNERGFGRSHCQLWRSLTFCGGGYRCSYETTELERSSCNESLAARQNMRGLVGSTDLEMELAETDEVMVRQKD